VIQTIGMCKCRPQRAMCERVDNVRGSCDKQLPLPQTMQQRHEAQLIKPRYVIGMSLQD